MTDPVDERSVRLALDLIGRGHTPGGILRSFTGEAETGGASDDLLASIRADAAATVTEAVRRAAVVSGHCACAHCSAAEGHAATAEAQRIVSAETNHGGTCAG